MIGAEIGAVTAKLINAAQLSQLWGKRAVTPEETEEYLRKFGQDTADLLETGDRIALELTRPYRLNG